MTSSPAAIPEESPREARIDFEPSVWRSLRTLSRRFVKSAKGRSNVSDRMNGVFPMRLIHLVVFLRQWCANVIPFQR